MKHMFALLLARAVVAVAAHPVAAHASHASHASAHPAAAKPASRPPVVVATPYPAPLSSCADDRKAKKDY